MQKLSYIIAALLLAFSSNAATNITSSTVSGHWTLAGSPYLIFNDITVVDGDALEIDPGVNVIFQGFYTFYVQGDIRAIGTAAAPVTFSVTDTTGWADFTGTLGSWRGFYIEKMSATPDSTTFQYCRFYDTKVSAAVWSYGKSLTVKNCEFAHNNIAVHLMQDSLNTFEMSGCTLHHNISTNSSAVANSIFAFSGLVATTINPPLVNIHDCKIYNNITGHSTLSIYYGTCTFQNNSVHNNEQVYAFASSIFYSEMGHAFVANDSFYENTTQEQGAVSFKNSVADMNKNYVANNTTVVGDSGPTCYLTQGGGGIRLHSDSSIYYYVLRNNIVANNYAAYEGGAVYGLRARATLLNNTIINNESPVGEAISFQSYSPTHPSEPLVIKNNIFHNNRNSLTNTVANFEIFGDSTFFENNWLPRPVTMEYILSPGTGLLCLQGDTSTNIVGTDPQFVAPPLASGVATNARGADFSLQATSPCVNEGNILGYSAMIGTTDYLSHNRLVGTNIDMGACEYAAVVPTTAAHVQENETSIVAYPNPAMNVLFISTPTAQGSISIVDATGKEAMVRAVATTTTFFNVTNLPRGTYFAQWSDGHSKPQSQKVVVE